MSEPHDEIPNKARAAKCAGRALARMSAESRSAVLRALAERLRARECRARLMQANAEDLRDAEAALARGELSRPLVARLALGADKLDTLADGLDVLARAPDHVGYVKLRRTLDEGLVLEQVAAPLGVVGVVFEARPDAAIQIAGLALRSANAVLLKGGSEALGTNRAILAEIHAVLDAHGIARACVQLLERREDLRALLSCRDAVDLIVARGSSAFVRWAEEHATVPVMGHAEGVCHIVLDAGVEPSLATRVLIDAKTSYPAACNAVECLLWLPGSEPALQPTLAALSAAGVELRACPKTRAVHPAALAASEADWGREYGDLVLAVRGCDDLRAALDHIERHGSRHTEAILSQDVEHVARFVDEVDAACVFDNASTRFADGHRFGLGGEVGISTDKLHARGPVGAEGLLTYRWLLHGEGQVGSDYGPGLRAFIHRDE